MAGSGELLWKAHSAELVHFAYPTRPYVNMVAHSRTKPDWRKLLCDNAALWK